MSIVEAREKLRRRLFTDDVPRLWCPPLTYYQTDGSIDLLRQKQHLRWLADWTHGMLVPGSTGDGWDLTDEEQDQLIDLALEVSESQGLYLLIGLLCPGENQVLQRMHQLIDTLVERSGESDPLLAMAKMHVVGFTVCAPFGAALSDDVICNTLTHYCEVGVPICLYQLPQITQNTIAPRVVEDLVGRFPNLLMFKDSSGEDLVATCGRNFPGLFLMRGAEGHYERWYKGRGGVYDGFLLSSVNAFPQQYHELLQRMDRGAEQASENLSNRLTAVVLGSFSAAEKLQTSNMFSTANKAMHHIAAYRKDGSIVAPPMLRSGYPLSVELLQTVAQLLEENPLLPIQGDAGGIPG